ncbi:MAG: Swarming motility protein ybiA [Chlorobi bacterium]|nr:Swarming motility protein ybiA [Chlorobiota bacterium]
MSTIRFYGTKDAHGCFSNFAAYPIEIDGKVWPTSEHYFQGSKFPGTGHDEEIRLTPSPMIAARKGRDRKRPLRPDWEAVRDEVMLVAVRTKFRQHPELAATLLDTGDAEIIEHTKRDSYWGDGGDGSGRNMLGRILMRVRDELRGDRIGNG